jgi:hypothetical protein
MTDNPHKKKADGKLVSQQKHEIDYLARKTGLPKPLVSNVQKQVGPSRTKVEQKLNEMKRNGKK